MSVLLIGDSSAVGVGASGPLESVAGRLGARFPTADIINRGHNGDKVQDVLTQFQEFEGRHFDIIVIQAGGNDGVRLTPANGVDIWREADKDPFELYADKYYAAGFFHPSSIGYGFWYEQVEKEIDAQMNKEIME